MTSFSVCRKRDLHKDPPPELITAASTAFARCCRSAGTTTSDPAANVNTIGAQLQQDGRKRVAVSLFFRFYYGTRDDTDLAGALSAAVHRPFILVLVHNAVVDADSTLVHLLLQQRAFLRLRGREGQGGREERELIRRMENFHFAKVPAQMNRHCD